MKQHDQLYDRQFQEYYANWEQQKLNSKQFQEDPELLLLKAKIARLE